MAKMVGIGLAMMFVLLVTEPTTVHSHSKVITIYGLVIPDGPNANILPVAGNPNRPINATKFGTVSVVDIAATEGTYNPNSPPFSHSQGIQVISSTAGNRAYLSFSTDFDRGEYKGSTLQVQGTVGLSRLGYDGELSVVGGTGTFRNVTGHARIRTVFKIPGTNNVVNKLEFFVKCISIYIG